MKKINWKKIIGIIVIISFIVPVLFLTYRIITTPNIPILDDEKIDRTKSDYVIMLVQCLLGIVAFMIPSLATKKFRVEIPFSIYTSYVIFLYCAIFLGEVRNFYYIIPYWDTILHAFSGAMIGALGFSFVSLLNHNKGKNMEVELTPFFVAFFSFCFAMTLGIIWEIYEYTFDGLFGINMQKYMMEDGIQLIGRVALMDTMEDIIVDAIGALIMSIVGYISLKYDKGWIEKLIIHKKKSSSKVDKTSI